VKPFGAILFAAAALACAPAALADGSFTSSDPLLNRIWAASVKTATDMLVPGPLTIDSRGYSCAIDEPIVILDGKTRDRCPYIGDEAVTGMTLLLSTPSAKTAIRNELDWFAANQHSDGAVPASPLLDGARVLFDYESYWVQCLYDYVLYTGDRTPASQIWPNLVALIDTWYPSTARSDGLIVNDLGASDYASIHRQGSLIAYFNAGYALALKRAAQIATWIGNTSNARTWSARAAALTSPFNAMFWDPTAGAYVDSPTGQVVHPEDGNVFAILAGLTTPAKAASALNYLSHVNSRPYGNTIADNNTWDDPTVWGSNAKDRVFPFIGYFELLARFQTGLDASAIDLIRREWGFMLTNGPGLTMWEDIGPWGGGPLSADPSWDHGWSSGAAPALTSYVLGVRPTSPGFATFIVDPHPGKTVTSASGTVPTPNGDLTVRWKLINGKPVVSVRAPAGETWTNRTAQSRQSVAHASRQTVPRARTRVANGRAAR
jgi:hypothetical protein